ncbi:hypothetical protein FRC08_012560 [Ceratobasidium sp. 394]|nr:hypothetical protein FRC08_012560 [Ceratobasidium sp. 394]KAG9100606.1 hypothetical protein FS749_014196 [Ceratobasidium sp. UAMH 11750]
MDAYDFITMVNELFRSQHASQIAAILLINSLVSFDVRKDRLVIEDADREAILSLSREFLHLSASLRVEVNFVPSLGIPEQVLRDAYSFGIDLKYMCKNPTQSSRSRMMEAHTLLCYAAIVRHFHAQLSEWDLTQIRASFQKDRPSHRSVNRTCGTGARRQKGAGRRMVDACLRSAHLRNTSTSTATSTAATAVTGTTAFTQTSSNTDGSSQGSVNEFGAKVRTLRPLRSRTNAQWI